GSLTVGRASTTVSLTSGPNPSSAGQLVTFVASVAVVAPGAGSPGGAVAFSDGSVAIGSAQVDGNGTASFSTTALTAGTHHVTATYSGDTNFVGSTSSPISQVVNAVVQTSTIADLIAKVRTLNLNGGQKNSLIAKLQAAQASLDRGNTTAAANQLGAFINEVHADEQSGKLTTTDGDPLAAAAQTIAAGL
ncbi:MAG TPA: Ig-like domain-containing protein, partial [Vicinamibacterales bacterium]|nr:Ig-like domain-containing protein [Vicinamibacterales bacterium]